MTKTRSVEILEALLLSTDRPLPASRLASVIPQCSEKEMEGLVAELNAAYQESGRAFRVRLVAGGYRLFTEPEFDAYVEALAVTTRETRLSQAALETLAVVAYRQPVSRTDVEFIRGCDCDGVLRTLLSRRLINIKGRSEAPGRPLLYATTDRFLEYFGLAGITDLPDWSEIVSLVGETTGDRKLTLVRGPEQAGSALEVSEEPGDELLDLEVEPPEQPQESSDLDIVLDAESTTPTELAVVTPGEDAP